MVTLILTSAEWTMTISLCSLFVAVIWLIIKVGWHNRKELSKKLAIDVFKKHELENEKDFESFKNLFSEINKDLFDDKILFTEMKVKIDKLTENLNTSISDIKLHVQQYNDVTNSISGIKMFIETKCKDCQPYGRGRK